VTTPERRFRMPVPPSYDEKVLSVEQADAMALVYGSHMSLSDAAHHLGIAIAEVHQLIKTARARLDGHHGAPPA
jgi:predicted DNA-binding protein (UPF0251 family)